MYMVMSATELTAKSLNHKRAFELNALNLTKADAIVEAARRNAVEKAAGHDNVLWYHCWQMPPVEELMKLPREQRAAAMREPK